MDDADLLRDYAANRSETAFAELVRRHVDLVFSAALRQVGGDHHRAAEVTQMVFTDLARKAASLVRHPVLLAWLYRSTRYAASSVRRDEQRRRALAIDVANETLAGAGRQTVANDDWETIRPVIDETLEELGAADRSAVILRFFANRPFSEIGRQLGLSENAARMRVERALDKLHALLARRGITSTSAALGAVLSANAVSAAPAALSASIAGAAIAATPAAAATLATFFAMTKIQIGIVGIIILAGTVPLLTEVQARRRLDGEFAELRGAVGELVRLRKESEVLTSALRTEGGNNPEVDELARARKRITDLKNRPDGVVDSEMRPIANLGRATPDATYSSFIAAISAGDLDGVASVIAFRDGASQEQKDAFMANFSDVVRARYRTPERLMAAAYVGVREGKAVADPAATFQVIGSEELFPGFVQIRIWVRGASGKESELKDTFQRTADGWAMSVRPIADERTLALVRSRLDPTTGELVEPKR